MFFEQNTQSVIFPIQFYTRNLYYYVFLLISCIYVLNVAVDCVRCCLNAWCFIESEESSYDNKCLGGAGNILKSVLCRFVSLSLQPLDDLFCLFIAEMV